MTRLKVVKAPAAVLNETAKVVDFKLPLTPSLHKEGGLQKLLLDMEETLRKHEDPPGVGLAAPQVGVGLRIFLAVVEETKNGEFRTKNNRQETLDMKQKTEDRKWKTDNGDGEGRGEGNNSTIEKNKIKKQHHIEVFINPEILEMSGSSKDTKEGKQTMEGCLSLKNIYGLVERASKVKVRYFSIDLNQLKRKGLGDRPSALRSSTLRLGLEELRLEEVEGLVQEKVAEFEGFEARIIQHEMDHLNGRLFTSRIVEQGGRLYEQVKSGEEEWREVEIG